MKYLLSSIVLTGLIVVSGCKKDGDPVSAIDTELNGKIISDFAVNIASTNYTRLAEKTALLHDRVLHLDSVRTDESLTACRQTWRDARRVWEQSEALLFGPVKTDNIDPRIDTWPVNFTDLDAQLASGNEFTADYINGLEDALKGFHPIEYILFGENGNKSASQLTDREMAYLKSLSSNVMSLTSSLAGKWDSAAPGAFFTEFSTAGNGSTIYSTQQAALEQLVNAMSAICDEVANGKLKEPYEAQDPTLEESPFSKNSITDFTNNIQGIQNVYLGKFETDGMGLEDLVKKYNLSLDSEIKVKINAALASLSNITHPFGEAIIDQHVLVENAMTSINDLHDALDQDLLPFVVKHSK